MPVVPIEVSPYRNSSNADARWQIIQREAQKKLEGYEASAKKGANLDASVERFLYINDRYKDLTGRNIGSWPELQKAARPGAEADAIAEMQSLSTQSSREQRQSGEGPMTDSDALAFEKMIFNPKNNYQANVNIARAFQARAKQAQDFMRYMGDYNSVHQHLGTAQNEWQKYAKANPILSTDKNGNYVLNERRQSYQDYFRKQNQLRNEKGRLEREIKAGTK